jgi:hypothetical protein
MSVCDTCGRKYEYDKKKGHNKARCNSCHVNIRRFKIKKQCLEYKGGKCIECGYSRCDDAMHFHHLDPKSKDFRISGAHSRSWKSIKDELDKCILLCANCHSEAHVKMRK